MIIYTKLFNFLVVIFIIIIILIFINSYYYLYSPLNYII